MSWARDHGVHTTIKIQKPRDRDPMVAIRLSPHQIDAEAKNINKALQALEKRKQQCTNGLEMRRKRQEQQQQQQQTIRQQQQEQEQQERSDNEEQREGVLENTPAENMRISVEAPLDQYWDVRENSAQDILVLMLRMFLPTCGVLSKARVIQWGVVEKDVLPRLSKAAVDAKEQEYHWRMLTIEGELAKLAKITSNEDNVADNNVNATVG
jgi:hypothetical protein